jgi:hypothetical protein
MDVLWMRLADDHEFLIAAPGPWRLVTADRKWIDSLARSAVAAAKANEAAHAVAYARLIREGDLWGGWTGEEP